MQPVTEYEQCCYILCIAVLGYCITGGFQIDYLHVALVLGFACQIGEGIFPQIAPCLEHVCAGGGGVV